MAFEEPLLIPGPVQINGPLTPTGFNPPAGCITDAAIAAGSPSAVIAHSKLAHYFPVAFRLPTIAAATHLLHLARKAGLIVALEVVPLTAPSGGDKAYTVDLKKGNQATPPASILTAPLDVDSGVADRQAQAATPTTTALADGDVLTLDIALSGTTGNYGADLLAIVWIAESPV